MQHKKIFALLAVLTSLPALATAQQFLEGGIAYNVLSETDHTVEVTTKWPFYNGNVVIPSTVTHAGTTYDVVALGEYSFYGATLSSVVIPTSVTRICAFAFFASDAPTSITVPASVIAIGQLAFAANHLTAIIVDEDNPVYRTIDGMLFSKDTATVVESPITKSGVISLPLNTRHIAQSAFTYCQSLTGIVLPDSLSDIGYGAFVHCNHLNNVSIPSSVTHLGYNIFSGCTSLDNLSIEAGNTHYYMDGMMIYTMATDTLLSCHKSADSLFLPATLRAVGGLGGNSDVRHVHLPCDVTTILENAFEGSSLQSIDLPESITFIDEYAFIQCTSLTQIVLPTTLDSMGAGCFEGCTGLTSISIPDGLRTVPKDAFYSCERLSSITWGDAVEVIDSFAFGGCAFVELRLPPTLRSIRCGAFNGYYDGHLQNVIFTAPVDTIEAEAFYGHHLDRMLFHNTVPPATSLEYGCFETAPDSILIPCGSLNAWQSDLYWRQFADIYHEDCRGIDDVAINNIKVYSVGSCIIVEGTDGEEVQVFDIMGRHLNTKHLALNTGIYLVRVGDRPACKVAITR